EREPGLAGHHVGPGRRRHAASAGGAIFDVFYLATACDRVLDGTIAGATADVALQLPLKVGTLPPIEPGRGHDHAGRAEAALEALGVEEGALHRMRLVAVCKALDGGDGAALSAEGRRDAAMHRRAVDPYGTGAAVASIAALLDAKPAEAAQ